jgi:hypothetical protein
VANLFVGITIIILIILIIISSVKANILVLKEDRDSKVIISIKALYGLIRFKKELGSFQVTKTNKEDDEDLRMKIKSDSWSKHKGYTDSIDMKKIKNIIENIRRYKRVINYLIEKTHFHRLFWKTEIGLDDAALTGMVTGIINILKSNLFAILNNKKNRPKEIHFKITPNFNNEVLRTDIDCIFTSKIGYIIIAGLKILWIKYTIE